MGLKVAIYVSGNLAASTLALVVGCLRAVAEIDVVVLTDGNILARDLTELEPLIVLSSETKLPKADLLIVAPVTPGTFEGQLSDAYRRMGAQILGICSDLGLGPDKYMKFSAFPDIIAIPDPVSMRMYLDAGVPKTSLRPTGSPYFDALASEKGLLRRSVLPPTSVAYLEVPNTWDWKCKNLPNYYSEEDIATDIRQAAKCAGLKIAERPHPRTLLKSRAIAIDGPAPEALPIVQFLATHQKAVSTYSTTLLIAKTMGLSTFSYQPSPSPTIRREIFDHCGIPIIRNEISLKAALTENGAVLEGPCVPFWYQPGEGLKNIFACVEELASSCGMANYPSKSMVELA